MTFWIVSLGIMKQLKFKDIKDNTRNWKIFARFMLKGLGSDVIMVLSIICGLSVVSTGGLVACV